MVDQQVEVISGATDAIPPAQFVLRAALIAVQIVVVIYLGQPGALFFYQLF
jgi:hypothetical protein